MVGCASATDNSTQTNDTNILNIDNNVTDVKTLDNTSQINNLDSQAQKLEGKDIKSTYGKQITFSVKVLDSENKILINKSVLFSVDGKNYTSYSDSDGIASINLNLNSGSYTVKYSCDNASGSNTVKINNYYKIKIYKWKSGANVKRNKKIKSHIPKSSLVKKVVKAAKKGTPLVVFKGGKGKKVYITAGVHGNELSSQIAAMKLIKYLTSHPISGTVYIMPFINPKGTASNVRDYHGVHLNQKANVKGTISYKVVKLITKFKCDAYGDFHCTRPGGNPGKNIAMGTYNPTAKSAVMAKFISKKSNVHVLIYKTAGKEYPGALEDVVNLKHIPAVTCEVITPHGKIAKGSIGKSLSMMKSLLKFNSLL